MANSKSKETIMTKTENKNQKRSQELSEGIEALRLGLMAQFPKLTEKEINAEMENMINNLSEILKSGNKIAFFKVGKDEVLLELRVLDFERIE